MALAPLKAVSKSQPCPVCGGDHKCSVSADGGLILCGRSKGAQAGFVDLGPCRDGQWTKYRRAGPASLPGAREWLADAAASATALAGPGGLTAEQKKALAESVGLPVEALAHFPDISFDAQRRAFLMIEADSEARPVGVSVRFANGEKRMIMGSHRGLTFPGENKGDILL